MSPSSVYGVYFNMDYYEPSNNAILEIYADSRPSVDMLVNLSITNSSFFTNLPQTVTIVAGETYISIPLLVSPSISPQEGVTVTASTTLLSLYSEVISSPIGYSLSGKYQSAIMALYQSKYMYRTSDYGTNWRRSPYTTDNTNLYHTGETAGVYTTIIKRNVTTGFHTLLRSSNDGSTFSTVDLPSGASNFEEGWRCKNISLSSDGKNQCLTLFPSGKILYSNNYGENWSYFSIPNFSNYDFPISAISPDGNTMASIITTPSSPIATIYYSRDAGTSWETLTNISDTYFYNRVNKLYVGDDGYVLVNYQSFVKYGYLDGLYGSIPSVLNFAATPTSRFMMYLNESDNKLYRTSDYGENWEIVSTFFNRYGQNVDMYGLINSISMSKSGKYVTIGSTGGSVESKSNSRPTVYVSKNYGASFGVLSASSIFTSEPVDSYAVVSM